MKISRDAAEMDFITQNNANMAEQTAQVAESLEGEPKVLKAQVGNLTLEIGSEAKAAQRVTNQSTHKSRQNKEAPEVTKTAETQESSTSMFAAQSTPSATGQSNSSYSAYKLNTFNPKERSEQLVE